jgi:hypothetical protein
MFFIMCDNLHFATNGFHIISFARKLDYFIIRYVSIGWLMILLFKLFQLIIQISFLISHFNRLLFFNRLLSSIFCCLFCNRLLFTLFNYLLYAFTTLYGFLPFCYCFAAPLFFSSKKMRRLAAEIWTVILLI